MKSSHHNILLGVTGGIAAYKSADIIRRLQDQGATVRVVMTQAAEQFIGKVTLQALSGSPVYTDLFDSHERVMEHIDLARWANKILIAPASADCLAKLAHGHADNLLSTLCLAANCPVYLAPAMNHVMWANPATQNNIEILSSRDYQLLGPAVGVQACGETGPGRLLEIDKLIQTLYNDSTLLKNKNILITAGPTREAIDPVRYISNHSSGKMGYALAAQAKLAGADVTLISGPTPIAAPTGIKKIEVESAQQMHEAVNQQLSHIDIFIGAAAVADYRPQQFAANKIKKTDSAMQIDLQRNPDILASVASNPSIFCVGFAAETENLIKNASRKLKNKKLDMIIANQVGTKPSGEYSGFHSDYNALTVMTPDSQQTLAENHKTHLSRQLIQLIAKAYEKKHST
ncbi:MAG TPA: bifunctional phosphopantothenoylcysteine decarboxylase/phosphopantothenate--cysteine ligase CoaBC [Gammaproteobacteria bacterium]|nr:bifunctional phosphopantothenoylcysteine decarboxylase/phosphopantothenate--cysteine ligase CoaBC [Gammaproteobacteria bacterium]